MKEMVPQRTTLTNLVESDDPLSGIIDLTGVLIWIGITILCIFLPPLNQSILRIVFALPTILFLPGYVLIAALFPGKEDLDLLERVALSFGLSIAVVPLIGLVLNYTPWGIRLEPIVTSLVLFILALSMVGGIRRLLLPPKMRFILPLRAMAYSTKESFFPPSASRLDRALSVILLLSIVAAVGATIYVITVPKEGEKFTEFYILGENDKASDYPRDLVVGREYGVIIGIGNHEYQNVNYSVECHLMNISFDPSTNMTSVSAVQMLDRFMVVLPHNATYEERWNFTVPATGFNRLEFLLFSETVPKETVMGMDRLNASYRDLHLWVEIRPSRPE